MKGFFALCAGVWIFIFTMPLFTVDKLADAAPVVQSTAEAEVRVSGDKDVKITLWDGEKVQTLQLDEYLQGVVAAEMPALFPEEALKAQAVAARTYTVNRASLTPDKSHNGAMVCASPSHCKAYKPIEQAAANWGISREQYTQKIADAVADTDGQILLYDGKPISAVFHSSSAGRTERAADVWGSDVPYLQSVESPGEEESPSYYGTVEMDPQEFKNKFSAKWGSGDFSGSPETWFKNSNRSAAGGIITVYVGGVKVTGEQIRTLCGLRSTNFTVKYSGGKLVFDTIGYGHCVGMSQYGARAMANSGKNYRDILSWYYRGVSFGTVQNAQ